MKSTSLELSPGLETLPRPTRTALIDAARAFAREGMHRLGDPEDALLAHHVLESGRIRVLAEEDCDGQKLAIMGLPDGLREGPLLPELPVREGKATAYAALGHGLKPIAHELGVSVPTASRILASARRRLGVGSQAAVVALVHARARERARGG